MQQRAIMEQIGRGIAGQVKLGQYQRANAALGSIANSRQRNLGIASTSATRIRGDAAATRKKPSFLLAETQHCLVDLDTGGPFYPEIQSNGRSHISN